MKISAYLAVLPLGLGMCRCPEPPRSADASVVPDQSSAAAQAKHEGPIQPPAPLASTPADFDGWVLRLTEDAGFEVSLEHAPIVESRYLYFGPNWEWAGARVSASPGSGHTFTLDSKLPVTTAVVTSTTAENGLTFDYTFDVQQPLRQISGLALELRIDDAMVGGPIGEPKLRDDGRGLTIPTRDDGQTIEIEVDAPQGRVYFERGNPKQVRIVFLAGDVAVGKHRAKLQVRLPEGGRRQQATHARYGPENVDQWLENALVWNDWPVDIGFLNAEDRPVGKRGKVRVQGDDLVFADGTPARFWGANLAAYALFSGSDEDVALQAKRISALGFNLIRIHHQDSHWQPTNVFAAQPQSTRQLDENALQRLDWWIKCLEDQGVYVWIDIHVGRQFRASDDIPGFEELEKSQKGQAKGFNYVNPRIEALMAEFTEKYLQRKNRFTGKRWVDDPGVVAVLVTNENDLADHFGHHFSPDKKMRTHQAMFEKLAATIAAERKLPLRQALRIWEPGPAKVLLADLQHRFDARALAQLKKIGVDVPVATTSYWGRNALWSLPPLLAGDLVDAHSYGDSEALDLNPRYRSNWIHFLAGAQVAGKPFAVSEWNVPAGQRDRFTAATYIAAIGSLQAWDALVLYCYSQDRLENPKKSAEFSAWVDPSMLAMLPTAALMFRRGDLRKARETYVLTPSEQDVFGERNNAETSVAIRTLSEQHQLVIKLPKVAALPWLSSPEAPAGARAVSDLDRDFLSPDAQEIVSDTGEIRRNWGLGVQTIDTARTQVASGWIGGRRIALGDVVFTIRNPKATVAVTSLDGLPIAQSQRLLLTMIGRSMPNPKGSGWRSEPIEGSIQINHPHALRLSPLGASARGQRSSAVLTANKTSKQHGLQAQLFEIQNPSTHWFLLER